MRKFAAFTLLMVLLSTFMPTSASAFTAGKPEVGVHFGLSYNDDKGNGKYKGYSSEYVLEKSFHIAGTLEFDEGEGTTWVPDENQYPDAPENERLVKVTIYINGKAYEPEYMDREYYFQPGFFEFMEEWSLDKTRTDNDQVRVVVTSQDKDGNVVQEKEVYNQTLSHKIPTAAEFCKSPRSYMYASAPISLCDEIKNKQVEKNTEDIQENKEDIDQNKKDITENKEDIKVNKENIEVNKEDIEENKEDIEENKKEIDEVKEEVEEVKETVLELQTKVSGLEAKVKEVTNEVNGLKNYILSFSELKSDGDDEFKPVELWYRELVEEEVEEEAEQQVSFLKRLLFGSKVHAADLEWFREQWDGNSELTFEEGHNYEVFLVSENEEGTQHIEGYQFLATSDDLQMEQADTLGPFQPEKAEEEAFDEQEVAEIAAAPVVEEEPTSALMIFSLVIGTIGVIVLGAGIGFYFAKRKEIHAVFRK